MTDPDADGPSLPDEPVDPEWTAVQALLSANAATTTALQHLCFRLVHGGELDQAAATRLVEAAMDEHERAAEDLALARAAIGHWGEDSPEE